MVHTNEPTKPETASASHGQPHALFSPAFVRLLLVQFCYGMAYSTQFVLPKYLIEARDASSTLVGGAQGVFNLAALLSVPLVGIWVDRVGRKRVLLAGHVVGIVGLAPLGFVHDDAAILLLRVVHGVSFSLAFTAGAALAVDLAPESRRAESVGYAGTAMLVTNAFGPLLAEVVAARLGWSMVFVACSAYCAMAAVVALGIQAPALAGDGRSAPRIRPSAALAGGLLASLAIGVGVGVSVTFGPAAMVLEGATLVAPYFIGFTVGAVLVRVGFGRIPDRLGHLRATTFALATYAAGLGVVSVAPASYMFGGSFVIGVAHGVAYPAVAALTVGLVGPHQRGRALSWIAGCYNLGVASASAGLAPLEPAIGYRGLIFVGACSLGTLALVLPRIVRSSPLRSDVPASPV